MISLSNYFDQYYLHSVTIIMSKLTAMLISWQCTVGGFSTIDVHVKTINLSALELSKPCSKMLYMSETLKYCYAKTIFSMYLKLQRIIRILLGT